MSKTKQKSQKAQREPKPLRSKIVKVIALVLAAAIVLTAGFNIILNQNYMVSFYQVRCDKVTDNIRVVELADLHNTQYGKDNAKLVAKIKALKPDLIFYAGDMMNYKNDDYSVLFSLSDQLSEIAPIYACYGNNELSQYLFEDKAFPEKLESHHVELLSNEAVDVKVGNTLIQLIAVTEDVDQYEQKNTNAKKFVESLEPTTNCRICLTHYPKLVEQKLLDKGIDVAFTGHAHGGHVRLPKLGGLYSNGEGFLPKLTAGVHEMDDGSQLVISRGLGNHNIIPRINNQPELVVVDICWY
ncbi:MAG: metallophosphoesterase family protein [Clostridia bacterium]|nr:metallophosphoesterase family protein [Clostridia bacterium]